jgi:hypothetical protein
MIRQVKGSFCPDVNATRKEAKYYSGTKRKRRWLVASREWREKQCPFPPLAPYFLIPSRSFFPFFFAWSTALS